MLQLTSAERGLRDCAASQGPGADDGGLLVGVPELLSENTDSPCSESHFVSASEIA